MLANTGKLACRTVTRGIALKLAKSNIGGIDILIRNASAISLTKTVQTSMEKYDSTHGINGKGTFLVPSLNLNTRWFASDAKNEDGSNSAGTDEIGGIMKKIEGILSPDVVKTTNAIFQFDIKGDNAGKWYLDLKTGGGSVGQGDSPVKSDVLLSMASADFVKMFTGKLSPTSAYMTGKLKMKGDITKAMALDKLMGKMKTK